jgi:hypothetical protein
VHSFKIVVYLKVNAKLISFVYILRSNLFNNVMLVTFNKCSDIELRNNVSVKILTGQKRSGCMTYQSENVFLTGILKVLYVFNF